MSGAVAVLDVGKTHSKLAIVTRDGQILEHTQRANRRTSDDGRAVLDTEGIEAWLLEALGSMARAHAIEAIIPVGHGATAALVEGDALAATVLDYEAEPPADIAAEYGQMRDAFAETFSPRLGAGLNLGVQLYWQEQLLPDLWPGRADVLLWPQYWSFFLSGEKACEVTSLGCHTDVWRPLAKDFSRLAKARGWAERFPSRQSARNVLGLVRPAIARQTGLQTSCKVLCGVHDSNAALLALRRHAQLGDRPFTAVSTGTWFVAMRSGAADVPPLDEGKDTLVNVDADGCPVPSARFMGGREYATILGSDLGAKPSIATACSLVARGVRTRPSFVTGSGPFPHAEGAIVGELRSAEERASLAALHLALMLDASLAVLRAEGPVVIEGRFADDPILPSALASLMRTQQVLICRAADGIALGAAGLRFAELAPSDPLLPVAPLGADLGPWRENFRPAD